MSLFAFQEGNTNTARNHQSSWIFICMYLKEYASTCSLPPTKNEMPLEATLLKMRDQKQEE